jgi:uncharacterized membrane protein
LKLAQASALPPPTQEVLDPPRLLAGSSNAVTALIHLHRAESTSMTTSRQRMDTTTSWAITSTALVSTFALSNAQIPHGTFLFLMLVIFFFLQVEARRFCTFEVGRYRVLLLERWFYADVLGESVDRHWVPELIRALRTHCPMVNTAAALGWRLRRNYLWMYLIVFCVWVGKIALSGGPMTDPHSELATRASVGSISGIVVWAAVVVFYVWLILLAILAKRVYPMGDDRACVGWLR